MKLVRLGLNIGSVVLVAVLGWLGVRSVLGVVNPESLYVANPIVTPGTSAGAAQASTRQYNFTTDPFNFGEAAPVAVVQDIDENAPETTLNLKLKGIVSQSNATFSLANGKDKAVAIGNEVMNDVTLTATSKTFVILDVNGESQKLTLERVKLEAETGVSLISRAAPKTTPNANSSQVPNQADIESLFSRLDIKPAPDGSTGRLLGMRIQARSGADLSKYGLESGDIITRVGPVALNTRVPDIKALQSLLSDGAAQDVEVIRNGAATTIRIGQ